MAREHVAGRAVAKRVGLYLKVSTTGQTVENRRRELHATAERHGWRTVRDFEDTGISAPRARPKGPAAIRS